MKPIYAIVKSDYTHRNQYMKYHIHKRKSGKGGFPKEIATILEAKGVPILGHWMKEHHDNGWRGSEYVTPEEMNAEAYYREKPKDINEDTLRFMKKDECEI